jgi:hypothetical protein
VTVKFKVEKKTGKILDVAVDPARRRRRRSSASASSRPIDGLTLDPVDQRDGLATFRWTFKANPQKEAES